MIETVYDVLRVVLHGLRAIGGITEVDHHAAVAVVDAEDPSAAAKAAPAFSDVDMAALNELLARQAAAQQWQQQQPAAPTTWQQQPPPPPPPAAVPGAGFRQEQATVTAGPPAAAPVFTPPAPPPAPAFAPVQQPVFPLPQQAQQ